MEEEYEVYRSVYTIAQIEASIGKTPIIDQTTNEWMIWDIAAMQYVGTGISAAAQQSAADAAASAAAAAQSAAGAAADRAATQTAAQSATSSAAAAQGSRDSAAASAAAAAASAESVDADELNRRILAAFPVVTASGAVASVPDGADGIPVKTMTVDIDPVQAAGTPSPAAPLPISGWTGANIERASKNILPIPQYATTTESGVTFTVAPDGSVSTSGTATADIVYYLYVTSAMRAFCQSLDGVQVSFSCCPPGGSTETYRVLLARLASSTFVSDTGDGATFTINARYDGAVQYITINIKSGTNTDGLVFRPVMTVGSSVPGFEPVNRNTFNVSWQTEAGTVYGGTLTDNGDGTWTLNVEKVGITVDGTTTAIFGFDSAMDTEHAVACYFTASPALAKTNDYSGKILCDKMPPLSIAAARGGSPFTEYKNLIEGMDCSVAGYRRDGQSGNNYLFFSFNTTNYPAFAGKVVADANAWFAANPVQVAYELATPISYTISNAESVRTLLGENNIWSDAGSIAELVCRADPTLYVEERLRAVKRIIAGVETGTTATANYSVGDLLIVGDTLYKATAAIASGETIAAGTNVAATTVAEQLLLLANI